MGANKNFDEVSTTLFLGVLIVVISFGVCQNFTIVQYNEFEFAVSDHELPWSEAVSSCATINMSLVSVDYSGKDRALVHLFIDGWANVTLPGNNSWISATEVREGVWHWDSTQQPLYYSRWFIGQPDDLTSLNCAYQAVQGLLYWRDANCSAPMYYICERSLLSV